MNETSDSELEALLRARRQRGRETMATVHEEDMVLGMFLSTYSSLFKNTVTGNLRGLNTRAIYP